MAQIETKLGDVDANLSKHLALAEEAQEAGAQLILFPELSLTGYVLQDLTPMVACSATPEDEAFGPLLEASRQIDIVVGFVEAEQRHRYYIASAYLSRGRVLHVHRKVYLPTYGLFDEGRFFAAGDQVRAFDAPYGRTGLLICEDFWHASPPYLLWLDGADILLFVSASPGRGLNLNPQLESARWVELINQAYASLFTTFVVHANRVGFEEGLNFWGGSTAFDPAGALIAKGPYFAEGLTLVDLDLGQIRRTRARLPLLRDERPGLALRELSRMLETHDP
jgi:predicted amidohydrolase